ncbi:protein of unknown function [Xenorhabdus poinarii G6]|uniref:Selenide, water dikinase n=1 Tax=Xenorhabdus poinarii G6 TaxID=1354304 RepID=A0A068R5C6_9GAMM|nr:protein of unknown function [Xenorhabdus poinarii G6]
MSTKIRLTQYSHGAGCGCKIVPRLTNVDSGGLLLAVLPDAVAAVKAVARSHNIDLIAIGELTEPCSDRALIEVFE